MDKSWKDFWTSGKVEDYLTYRSRVEEDSTQRLENCHKQNRKQEEKTNKRMDIWDNRWQ